MECWIIYEKVGRGPEGIMPWFAFRTQALAKAWIAQQPADPLFSYRAASLPILNNVPKVTANNS